MSIFGGFLYLIDDIAATTKNAAAKTLGIVSDDLAVNAEQVTGVKPERELPVIWAVTKGSLRNKSILIPFSLLASYIAPWIISPVMLLGGLYLCFEGFEKIFETFFKKEIELDSVVSNDEDSYEKDKISTAIKTDFVLSLEIVVITLGQVAQKTLLEQAIILVLIGIFATFFVYGLVALIIRLDDIGYSLVNGSNPKSLKCKFGCKLISSTPYIMKALSVIGTVAMLSVGGELVVHHIHNIHQLINDLSIMSGDSFKMIVKVLSTCLTGFISGLFVFFIVETLLYLKKIFKI